jgi:hypothetical protein
MMKGKRVDTGEKFEIAYTSEDTGESVRKALEERIGAQVRVITQGRIWIEVEKTWQLHDRVGESRTVIRVTEELRKGRTKVKTQCGKGRWEMTVGEGWKEAEMIRTPMAHYRQIALQPPSLVIFDEKGRRKGEFEVKEGWTYILKTRRKEEENEEEGCEKGKQGDHQRDFIEGSTPDIRTLGSQANERVQNFIEGSTPDISMPGSQDAGESEQAESGTQSGEGNQEADEEAMQSEVVYGHRRMRIGPSGLRVEEAHTRVREAMGVPDETNTGLQWERAWWNALRFTLTNVWAEEREWLEQQGINVRLGKQLARPRNENREAQTKERRRAEEASRAEQVRVVSKWTTGVREKEQEAERRKAEKSEGTRIGVQFEGSSARERAYAWTPRMES